MHSSQVRAEAILSRLGANPVGAEIGVNRGALSSRLLVRPDMRLTMVDSWGEYLPSYGPSGDWFATVDQTERDNDKEAARILTQWAEERRTIIQGDSADSASQIEDGSLDFAFIDADHSYEGCKRDIDAWASKVKAGGLLCGHDYYAPEFPNWGVARAVNEWAKERGYKVETDRDDTWFIRIPGPLPEPSTTYDKIVIACVKWGDKYSASYVNVLFDMVARNLIKPHRFVCLTDDPTGLHEAIEVVRLPKGLNGWWNKVALFHRDMLPERSRIVFFDLDVVIVAGIEELTETKGIAADWMQGGYNSSVMVWDHGEHAKVWDWYVPSIADRLHGDQDWITELGGWQFLPPDWIVSYRLHSVDWPPEGAKVVAFHGEPKPHQITSGWVPDMWSMGGLATPRFTSLLNNDIKTIRENVEANKANWVPSIAEGRPHGKKLIIAVGGPSLADNLGLIQLERAKGAELWCVNGVHDYLIDRGIVPDGMVLLDSRKGPVDFVRHPHKEVEYLIATQCDPEAFHVLKGYKARKWTGWYWGVEDDILVGGGATVGLKAICLAFVLGYRDFVLVGYDSSYRDGNDHAYPQPMNANDLRVETVVKGRKFIAARWMVKQCMEFMGMMQTMTAHGCTFDIAPSDGLLPHVARLSVEAAAKADATAAIPAADIPLTIGA